MLENTHNLGAENLDMLNGQGEQLRKIQEHADNIEVLQDKADRHLRAIDSIGGVIQNRFAKRAKSKDTNSKADKLSAKQQTELRRMHTTGDRRVTG